MNKLKLLIIAVLQSIPKNVARTLKLNKGIEQVLGKLWKGAIVETEGIKYALVDEESFEIIKDFEGFMSLWFKPQEGEVMIDIGAHIGKYALSGARFVGEKGTVLAVEPNPANYEILRKNIRLNNLGNVVALNLAAWDRECILELFTGHLGGHHSTKIDWKLGANRAEAKRMDIVLKENGITKVDWIKVDVEGAEWEVLHGLAVTINESKPRMVVEVSSENIDKVKEFAKEHKYGIIKIAPLFEGTIYGISRKFTYIFFLPYS
jgi:FkbM family methyltransferase